MGHLRLPRVLDIPDVRLTAGGKVPSDNSRP